MWTVFRKIFLILLCIFASTLSALSFRTLVHEMGHYLVARVVGIEVLSVCVGSLNGTKTFELFDTVFDINPSFEINSSGFVFYDPDSLKQAPLICKKLVHVAGFLFETIFEIILFLPLVPLTVGFFKKSLLVLFMVFWVDILINLLEDAVYRSDLDLYKTFFTSF